MRARWWQCAILAVLCTAPAWAQVGSPQWFADYYAVAASEGAERAAAPKWAATKIVEARQAAASVPAGSVFVAGVFILTSGRNPFAGNVPDAVHLNAPEANDGRFVFLGYDNSADNNTFFTTLKRGQPYHIVFDSWGNKLPCTSWQAPASGPKYLALVIKMTGPRTCVGTASVPLPAPALTALGVSAPAAAPPAAATGNRQPATGNTAASSESFDTSQLGHQTIAERALWSMIQNAVSPQDKADTHRRLAAYYSAKGLSKLAQAETARAGYWAGQVHP